MHKWSAISSPYEVRDSSLFRFLVTLIPEVVSNVFIFKSTPVPVAGPFTVTASICNVATYIAAPETTQLPPRVDTGGFLPEYVLFLNTELLVCSILQLNIPGSVRTAGGNKLAWRCIGVHNNA
jgi:hypothetical protein